MVRVLSNVLRQVGVQFHQLGQHTTARHLQAKVEFDNVNHVTLDGLWSRPIHMVVNTESDIIILDIGFIILSYMIYVHPVTCPIAIKGQQGFIFLRTL